MQQTARRAVALLLVFAAGQSCVLEPLDANRVAPGGSAGESAGSTGKSGNNSAAGISGAAVSGGASSTAGTPAGGSSGMAGASSGAGGVAGNTAVGGAADAGAAGEPAVDWIKCDPTFAYDAYIDCPTIQPSVGEFCDPDVFYPTDFCAYCEDPSACPVDTAFVTLQCANRAWRLGTGMGIGCCPAAEPTHGTACDSSAYCTYGVFDVCECLESKWQCCPDAYDGAACDELGKECVVNYGDMDQDRCKCAGSAPANASWTCCPVFPPHDGDTCIYDAVTCAYPDRSCTCAANGSLWSCN